MVDTKEILSKVVKTNKALLEFGFDWDFIDKFWKECIDEAKGKA